MNNIIKGVFIAACFCLVASCSGGEKETAKVQPKKEIKTPIDDQMAVMSHAKDVQKQMDARTKAQMAEIE